MHSILSALSCLSFPCRKISYPSEIISAISLLIHLLFKSDGEHQEHRFRFWPAGAEQPGYRNADASTLDSGAILPAPDADDGHPEQHCSGTAAGSHAASASSTTIGQRHACGVSEGSPARREEVGSGHGERWRRGGCRPSRPSAGEGPQITRPAADP